jgi:sulfane dehydrogenase subunit SoxC
VSTAEWTGVALRSVLEPAGLSDATVEILFRGADAGTPPDLGTRIAFERSLPLARALADDVLVAYAMNGDEIPREHGAPARLIVPAWYGMASVKWLAQIVALERPFRGFYQAKRYVVGAEPVRAMKPRAVIVAPLEAMRGPATVRGFAWSGQGSITRVDLSVDGGRTWRGATLGPQPSAATWRAWQVEWAPSPGTYDLIARATDASGEQQPLANRANRLGYMNNAAQPLRVVAR